MVSSKFAMRHTVFGAPVWTRGRLAPEPPGLMVGGAHHICNQMSPNLRQPRRRLFTHGPHNGHGEDVTPGNGDALTRIGGLMVRVIHIANIGTETATVELDDSIVEVMYSGIADMLREAARLQKAERAAPCDVSLESHRRASGKFATASDAGRNRVLLAP